MENKEFDIEKILAEREKIDNILRSQFSREISVMFTDIKDSTSFYESKGDIDGRLMIHRHNEIVMPVIKENNCILIEAVGDGTMTVFDDPVNAVKSSIQIQRRLKEYNHDKTGDDRILLRIGMNHGTVISDKGGVYGDVVNVANRVESLADANEIFLTEEMYRAVRHNDEFIFRYVDSVEVKGRKEPVNVYRLVWQEEELYMGKTRAPSLKKEGVFVLEASMSGQKLKVSGFEKMTGEERPVKSYSEIKFNDIKIKDYTKGVIDLLNRANRRGKISSDLLVRLKEYGRLMFDELVPVSIKDKLMNTHQKNLMIHIDDKLVSIPWELLYDGRNFLCQRFNIGRSVSTEQQVSIVSRALGRPLKMQLLADPGGDLKASYEEGVEIKNEIAKLEDWINVSLKSTDIRTDYVKAKIRNFDIVHFAGHAKHDAQDPGKSGWILKDGKLSAREITGLTGAMPMPALVFSNACQTGQTDEWKLEEDCEDRIFGLANAFLLSGVQHYIGTFWEIPDEAGSYFAVRFYRRIAEGATIGEAVRQSRMALINKYGEDTIVWASYMLYGDPTTAYIHPDMEVREDRGREEAVSGGLRHKEEAVYVHEEKKSKRETVSAVMGLLFMIVAAAAFVMWDRGNNKATMIADEKGLTVQEKEESHRRVMEMIQSLAMRYRKGNFEQTEAVQDEWTSRPVTMVLMDIRAADKGDSDRLSNMLPRVLQGEERVNMVEREVLEKLLVELELGTSELADPLTSLRIGKLFSARIIITGSIIPVDRGLAVILRGIDTETSSVRKVISVDVPDGEINTKAIDDLGAKIVGWVRTDFPLQGRIVSVSGDRYRVNLGQMHGLKKGDRLEIMTGPPEGPYAGAARGEVEVVEAGMDGSWVSVSEGDMRGVKEGDRVREKRI